MSECTVGRAKAESMATTAATQVHWEPPTHTTLSEVLLSLANIEHLRGHIV